MTKDQTPPPMRALINESLRLRYHLLGPWRWLEPGDVLQAGDRDLSEPDAPSIPPGDVRIGARVQDDHRWRWARRDGE